MRAIAMAGVLVLPSTGLGTLVHLTHEGHATCPEHGELVHTEAEPEHGEHLPPSSVVAGGARHAAPHHHCTLSHASQDPNTVVSDRDSREPAAVRAAGRAAYFEPVARAPLTFAPKASPPA